MILDNFDEFNFMVVIVFLFFMFMVFIIIIIVNNKERAKNGNDIFNSYNPQTTQFVCNIKSKDDTCS